MSEDSRQSAIREIAYGKWELAGRPDGDGVNFWLDAEIEYDRLAAELSSSEIAESVTKPRKSTIPPAPLKLTKIAGQTRKKVG